MRSTIIILIILLTLGACSENSIPRPQGYFRIDLPEKTYRKIDTLNFPFTFELPQYALVNLKSNKENEHYLNIDFKRFGATIYLSYHPIEDNLKSMLEDSRSLAYKHTIKAQEINEKLFINEKEHIYSTYYEIEGDVASGSQFHLTDSIHYFIRGSLYFNVEPNFDSIAPVQNFIKKDIMHLIESFQWKNRPVLDKGK